VQALTAACKHSIKMKCLEGFFTQEGEMSQFLFIENLRKKISRVRPTIMEDIERIIISEFIDKL
jgi:hypothetical protein